METNDKIIRKCMNCGKEFEPNRADQLFCSPTCRVTYNRNMRKKEQAERAETEESLLEFEAQNVALKKSIGNKDLLISELQNEVKKLQSDNAELQKRLSNDGQLVIAIDNIARGVYERWCEVYEAEMPENYKEMADRFSRAGFTPNRYNMPVLACVMAFMGFGSVDFAELTRENIENAKTKYNGVK